MDDFIIRALAAGIGVAIAAGPLGSIVVWRRMAYFGDALSHSALLGIAMGFLLGINLTVGIVILSVLFSITLTYLQRQRNYSTDTLLGILAHSGLAIGLVVLSFIKNTQVDLMSYLFGDILAVSDNDIIITALCAAITLSLVAFRWRNLLLMSIHPDLARVEGVNVTLLRLYFMLLMAFFVAFSIKIVGILLVTSLLIIPAATARLFSRTPEQMVILSAIIGVISVIAGISASLLWDTPSGPSIVVAALSMFFVTVISGRGKAV